MPQLTSSSVSLRASPASPSQGCLAAGRLHFELVGGGGGAGSLPPFASLSSALDRAPKVPLFSLARAGASQLTETGLRIIRVKGDGRCMFRALALGMARNQGRIMGPAVEEQEADQLQLAVAEAICRTAKRRNEFSNAVIAIEAGERLPEYCKRIMSPGFWGGEAELLVLSQMLQVPIYVYLPAAEDPKRARAGGYVPIQRYGQQYSKPGKSWKRRRPVRLLYSGGNHYDLLIKI